MQLWQIDFEFMKKPTLQSSDELHQSGKPDLPPQAWSKLNLDHYPDTLPQVVSVLGSIVVGSEDWEASDFISFKATSTVMAAVSAEI